MKFKLILLLLSVSGYLFGQDLPTYVPVSPNAAELGRHGSFAVNDNLGKTNISIPLYTIQSGSLKLPISLSYNSSGILLNQRASWAGLGWNLNAGGAIVRNIRGSKGSGGKDVTNLPFNKDNFDYLYDVWSKKSDNKPDRYTLNALGINATFYVIRENGEQKFIFENNDKLVVNGTGNGFSVLTENGDNLIFEGKEVSLIPRTTFVTEHNVNTAYYLTKIISADKKDTISLDYKIKKSTEIPVRTMDSYSFESENEISFYPWYDRVVIDKLYLDKITFNNGYAQFNSNLDREDLEDEYRLINFKIYNNEDEKIREVHFNHSYYIRDVPIADHSVHFDIKEKDKVAKMKSLKLNNVKIGELGDSPKVYSFEYDNQKLPARGSSKQDFWGYINNNISTSLLPETNVKLEYLLFGSEENKTFGDANRNSDPVKMQSGILKKIIYPTGGYTEFEYEANQYLDTVYEPIYENFEKKVFATGAGDCYGQPCNSNGKQQLEFTVEEFAVDAKLKIIFSEAFRGDGGNSYAIFSGLNRKFGRSAVTGGSFPATSYDLSVNLPRGTYVLEAEEKGEGSNPPHYFPSVSMTLRWKTKTGSTKKEKIKYVGGLRIKSIKNYDGFSNTPISSKYYTYENPNVINEQKETGYVLKKGALTGQGWDAIVSSSSSFNNNINLIPAIEYGSVIETYSENGEDGKVKKIFETIPLVREISDSRKIFAHPEFDFSYLYDCPPDLELGCNFTGEKMDIMMNSFEDIADLQIKPYKHGFLKSNQFYKGNKVGEEIEFKLISEENYEYKVVDESFFEEFDVYTFHPDIPFITYTVSENPYIQEGDLSSALFYYNRNRIYHGRKLLNKKETIIYDLNSENPVKNSINYTYNDHYLITKIKTETSDNKLIEEHSYYVNDITDVNSLGNDNLTSEEMYAINLMKTPSSSNPNGLNIISTPIQTERTVKDNEGIVLTKYTKRINLKTFNNNAVLPTSSETLKGNYNVNKNPMEERVKYLSYYLNGNIREVSKKDGIIIVYIWGYNEEYPIAKIENATYADVENYVSDLQTKSNADRNAASENELRTALNNLRKNLPNAMVSTYTYDPLIGVTSMTDPKGYTMYYHYDVFNRLEYVTDAEGNVLSANEYNYKN